MLGFVFQRLQKSAADHDLTTKWKAGVLYVFKIKWDKIELSLLYFVS